MIAIISWIVFGLVVGVLAKLVMPGNDPGGYRLARPQGRHHGRRYPLAPVGAHADDELCPPTGRPGHAWVKPGADSMRPFEAGYPHSRV